MHAIAIAPRLYEPPALRWGGEPAQEEGFLWWIVFVGFAYALALAWASWCRVKGGYPEISLGWSGFKVACYR